MPNCSAFYHSLPYIAETCSSVGESWVSW